MEKYRSTADRSTGVHPYLPPPPPPLTPFYPILILLRLPLLLVSLPLVALLHLLHRLPSALPTRLLTSLTSNLLLLSLSHPPTPPTPLYRNPKHPQPPPPPSSLVLTNLHSPMPILHLSTYYTPPFLFPTQSSLSLLSPSSLYTLLSTGKLPQTTPTLPHFPIQNLPSLLSASKTPVVLLTEGAVTNGKGLLAFPPTALAAILNAAKVAPVYALGYAPQTAATFCGVGSFARYILHMMACWRTPVDATYVQVHPDQIRDVQAILARCAKVPPLAITRDGRDEFDAHWNETRPSSRRHLT